MSFTSLLNQTATIERNSSPAVGDTGKVSAAWSTVATGVPCAIQPHTVRSTDEAFGQALNATHVGYFLAGADIEPEGDNGKPDRVTVDGVKYLCRGVENPAGRGKLKEVLLERQA